MQLLVVPAAKAGRPVRSAANAVAAVRRPEVIRVVLPVVHAQIHLQPARLNHAVD
jgi:pyrimidine operon attenuation protein/uracil phosphoribosyltransferase